jgi:pimeloyl-[acyl-carrier protein] methyl ester esterase
VLLGESFSGPIAMRLAAEKPRGLQALILSTTFAKNPIPLSSALLSVVDFFPLHVMPYPAVAWWLLGAWATPVLDQQLQHATSSISPAVLRSRARIALQTDVSACLPKIDVPTLCLRASQDRLMLPSTSRQIAAGIRQCALVEIAAPHLLLQTMPIAAAKAITDFVARCR